MGQYCVSSFVCSCSGAGEGSGFPDAEAKVGCAGGISASLFEGYHRASGLSRERKLESIHKESMVLYVKEPGKRLRFSLTAGLAVCHGWSAEPAHIADDAPRRRAQALRAGQAHGRKRSCVPSRARMEDASRHKSPQTSPLHPAAREYKQRQQSGNEYVSCNVFKIYTLKRQEAPRKTLHANV